MKLRAIKGTVESYLVTDSLGSESLQYFNNLPLGDLKVNGRVQQRPGMFMGESSEDAVRWLRCPSIEGQQIRPFDQFMGSLIGRVKGIAPNTDRDWNIAKVQAYPDGDTGMKNHSDKILDLAVGVPICIARFGASRTALLVHKGTGERIQIPMPDNSLLVIGYEDNITHTHGVVADNTITKPSYSVVLRQSVTWLHSCGCVFGPRTPLKTDTYAQEALLRKDQYWSPEKQRQGLIRMFREENANPDFSIKQYRDIMDNCIYP